MLKYKVSEQYMRGHPNLIAQFKQESDARTFIQSKREENAKRKVKVIYYLEGERLHEEFSPDEEVTSSSPTSTSSGAQQRSSFQPTPFNMIPRPTGSSPHWARDDKEKDKK